MDIFEGKVFLISHVGCFMLTFLRLALASDAAFVNRGRSASLYIVLFLGVLFDVT